MEKQRNYQITVGKRQLVNDKHELVFDLEILTQEELKNRQDIGIRVEQDGTIVINPSAWQNENSSNNSQNATPPLSGPESQVSSTTEANASEPSDFAFDSDIQPMKKEIKPDNDSGTHEDCNDGSSRKETSMKAINQERRLVEAFTRVDKTLVEINPPLNPGETLKIALPNPGQNKPSLFKTSQDRTVEMWKIEPSGSKEDGVAKRKKIGTFNFGYFSFNSDVIKKIENM